ncbi:MAG: pantothenate kinase, partial [Acinetobacter sp.]|nr:pantothenate kinase [Acinetobacter sp.]
IQNTKGIKIADASFDELSPGKNTIDAVHHGILLSLLSTIEKVLDKYPSKLILTGGDAQLFAKFLMPYQPEIEPDLLLKGLQVYVDSSAKTQEIKID